MQEMTIQAIRSLLAETGHALVVEDFDQIEVLDGFAARFTSSSPLERRILRQPYVLSGVSFYPLTIAKTAWFDEKSTEWDLSESEKEMMQFWMLSLPLTSEALDEYSDRRKAGKAISAMAKRLNCTRLDMHEVVQKCVRAGSSEPDDGDDSLEVKYGAIVSMLIREYGGTPNQWIYETPAETIGAMFDQLAARGSAEQEGGSVAGKAVAPKATARLGALREFHVKLNLIKEAWLKHD